MQKKLLKLYNECINELNSIGIDMTNNIIGKIDITITNRSKKRYGVCKQEDPYKKYIYRERKGRRIITKCNRYNLHRIEISRWVMDLDEYIIKNTIIHELIHCIPFCCNHGQEFKKYANIINAKLGYNIKTVGNKQEDYKKSNIEYEEPTQKYKYKIKCLSCGKEYLRIRKPRNIKKYRCGICNGKLDIEMLN